MVFGFCLLVFQNRVSLYSPGFPGTHSVSQADLEVRNPPASVLGLKVCTTTALLTSEVYWGYLEGGAEMTWRQLHPKASMGDGSQSWEPGMHCTACRQCDRQAGEWPCRQLGCSCLSQEVGCCQLSVPLGSTAFIAYAVAKEGSDILRMLEFWFL